MGSRLHRGVEFSDYACELRVATRNVHGDVGTQLAESIRARVAKQRVALLGGELAYSAISRWEGRLVFVSACSTALGIKLSLLNLFEEVRVQDGRGNPVIARGPLAEID